MASLGNNNAYSIVAHSQGGMGALVTSLNILS